MTIPFVDLYAQYLSIKPDIDAAIETTIKNSSYIGGRVVTEFEEKFAAWIGAKYCIAAGNGTDTLEILLKAYGIGAGDEVIIPSHSWVSTAETVVNVGGVPVFVDTDARLYTLNVDQIEKKINSRTKAIIPVHLFGLPAEMDRIMEIANKHNLVVIEDCAQCHGAEYKGKRTGTFGHAASFSFYPGKNLGAYGDAGCIVTNDENIAKTCRMIANHGQLKKHDHQIPGRNSRLDGLQAAILTAKLKYLDKWTDARIANAAYYNELFKDSVVVTPVIPEHSRHVFHLYVVQVNNRSQVQEALREAGIETAVHYPVPMPAMPAFKEYINGNGSYEVNEGYKDKLLSLPMFPELTHEQMQFVASKVLSIAN